MMKANNSPRQIYVRKEVVHLCFKGKLFAAPSGKESKIKKGSLVKVEEKPNNKIAVISFGRSGMKVTEIWNYRKAI